MRNMDQFKQTQAESPDFQEKKRRYFIRLMMSVRNEAIKLHQTFGLFEKKPVEDKDKLEKFLKRFERKHQAPEHMFMVTARVQILAEWLGLSEKVTRELTIAAALHDAYKAIERDITNPLDYTYQSFRIAEAAEVASLREMGVSEDLITLQNAGGHDWTTATELTDQDDMMDEGWAWLVLYAIDMYSRGIEPVTSIHDRLTNDRRFYTKFDETAKGNVPDHPEEGGFDAMERTGNAALVKIAKRISERLGGDVDPEQLPLLVDKELRRRIEEEK